MLALDCSHCGRTIVIDSRSTDHTVSIARSFGAKVEITDWPGFGPQKNRALS
jgi:glycosyltransferase involved in cell wall biosynthesis